MKSLIFAIYDIDLKVLVVVLAEEEEKEERFLTFRFED